MRKCKTGSHVVNMSIEERGPERKKRKKKTKINHEMKGLSELTEERP